jgi:adenylate cyclase class IV
MSRPRLNTYERILHRLDGLDVKDHYMKVIRRVQKYSRRLVRAGFAFDKKKDVFTRGKNHVTLDYVENFCDFTDAEFKSRYGGW